MSPNWRLCFVNCIFLCGSCFSTVLYLVGKYSLIKHGTLSICSRLSVVFPVLQMNIVCISVSKTVNHLQEIRQIAQGISQFHGIMYDMSKTRICCVYGLWKAQKNRYVFYLYRNFHIALESSIEKCRNYGNISVLMLVLIWT